MFISLGALKWPLFALFMMLLATIILLPAIFMLIATFMKVFGVFDLPDPWTIGNWQRVLGDRTLIRSLTNTLVIADRGFPFWPQIETIDISLVDDIPRVLDVLQAIRSNFVIGTSRDGCALPPFSRRSYS